MPWRAISARWIRAPPGWSRLAWRAIVAAMPDPAVLFVCLGNICRSPMAEGAFRRAAAEAGLVLTIDSAGTGGWHAGDPPDPRAIAMARAQGVDIGKYSSPPPTKSSRTFSRRKWNFSAPISVQLI